MNIQSLRSLLFKACSNHNHRYMIEEVLQAHSKGHPAAIIEESIYFHEAEELLAQFFDLDIEPMPKQHTASMLVKFTPKAHKPVFMRLLTSI